MDEVQSTDSVSTTTTVPVQRPIQYKNWVFTLHYGKPGQPSFDEAKEFFRALSTQASYAIAGCEIANKEDAGGAQSGGGGGAGREQQHLQGYVQLLRRRRLTELRKLPGARTVHWEPQRGDTTSAVNYCRKEGGEILEHGVLQDPDTGKSRLKRDWGRVLELAKTGDMENIDPQIQIVHCRALEFIEKKYRRVPDNLPHTTKHVWIWGPTGTGKSLGARRLFAEKGMEFYDKMCNKWWDHYKDQDGILIDDIQLDTAKMLTHFFKRWFDIYPFNAEVKCGVMMIRFKYGIVTSNWHPYQIWGDSPQDWGPIERRFNIVPMFPPMEDVPYYGPAQLTLPE